LLEGSNLLCCGLVVKDADEAVADLEEVDVSGDWLPLLQVEGEAAPLVVPDVLRREIDRHFRRDGAGVVGHEEVLHGLMPLLVGFRELFSEGGEHIRRVVLGPNSCLEERELYLRAPGRVLPEELVGELPGRHSLQVIA